MWVLFACLALPLPQHLAGGRSRYFKSDHTDEASFHAETGGLEHPCSHGGVTGIVELNGANSVS